MADKHYFAICSWASLVPPHALGSSIKLHDIYMDYVMNMCCLDPCTAVHFIVATKQATVTLYH